MSPASRARRVPVIMYHKVGAGDRFLDVEPAAFARHMRALVHLGHQGVTFRQAVEGLFHGGPLPRRAVCITFDDGYTCVGEHAAPVLAEIGWPATVFVPSAFVGDRAGWLEAENRPTPPIMAAATLRALIGAGWEVSGHGRTHPDLTCLGEGDAADEIVGGAADLWDLLGHEVRTFCYPYGRYDERTPRLVRAARLLGACTTRSGIADDRMDAYLLPRVKPSRRGGLAGFLYRLLIRPRLP